MTETAVDVDAVGEGRKRIVVLGCGYAGARCAKDIQDKLGTSVDLTVVDRRKAMLHKVGAARAAVIGDNFSERVLIKNDKVVREGLGRMVYGDIVEVTVNHVLLADGTKLPFDFLVCATGTVNSSVCEPPLKYSEPEQMKRFFGLVQQEIKSADRILIVGGGSTGVELAGEIKCEYGKDKKVTLVHSREMLLSKITPFPGKAFEKRVMTGLADLNVDVLKNQRVLIDWNAHGNKPFISNQEGGVEYETDKGHKIVADLVLLCAGNNISNGFYSKEWLNKDSGQMKVRSTLQILDHDHIFCVGDLSDVAENKQTFFAGLQGRVAVENIKRMIQFKGNGNAELKKHSPGFGVDKPFMFLTLGRHEGVGHLGWFSVGSWLAKRVKSKNLSVDKIWKFLNRKGEAPDEVVKVSEETEKTESKSKVEETISSLEKAFEV